MTKHSKYRKFIRFIWVAFGAATLGIVCLLYTSDAADE